MTTLAADSHRTYELNRALDKTNDLPVIASDIIYEGAAVGDNGSGLARPLVAGDPFMGFALKQCDNSAGAASAKNVNLQESGGIVLDVTGVSSAADVGEAVYATDDNVFTLTASGASAIGKVMRWISSTKCVVKFESVAMRSI